MVDPEGAGGFWARTLIASRGGRYIVGRHRLHGICTAGRRPFHRPRIIAERRTCNAALSPTTGTIDERAPCLPAQALRRPAARDPRRPALLAAADRLDPRPLRLGRSGRRIEHAAGDGPPLALPARGRRGL